MILNRRFPIHRSGDTYDPEEYAAATRLLEEMAAEDPSAQAFLDTWNEGTAMIEQWEHEAEVRHAETEERSSEAKPLRAERQAA